MGNKLEQAIADRVNVLARAHALLDEEASRATAARINGEISVRVQVVNGQLRRPRVSTERE